MAPIMKMKNLLITLCLPLGFGCSQILGTMNTDTTTPQSEQSNQLVSNQRDVAAPVSDDNLFQSGMAPQDNYTKATPPMRKNINHYVRGIMQDMVENLQYVSEQTPLAVSSFIFLDEDVSKQFESVSHFLSDFNMFYDISNPHFFCITIGFIVTLCKVGNCKWVDFDKL